MLTRPHARSADPVHRAASVLEALRLRQQVHSNISRGLVYSHRTNTPSEGFVSATYQQHARLRQGLVGPVVLVDLRTGAEVRRVPLPGGYKFAVSGQACCWDGKVLALTTVRWKADSTAVLLVDTSTGVCTPVTLPGEREALAISSWSSTGFLLMKHKKEDGEWFSVVSAQGQVVCSVASPSPRCGFHSAHAWAPDAHAAVLQSGSRLWLWDVFGSEQLTLCQLADGDDVVGITWSWESSALLISIRGGSCVYIWDPQQGVQAAVHPVPGYCVAWGRQDCVALLQRPFGEEETGLLGLSIYLVTSNGLQPFQLAAEILDCRYTWTPAACACAPNGALLCLATSEPQAVTYTIDILDLTRRSLLRRFAVPFPARSLAWSANSACVVVGDGMDARMFLMDFA